MIAPRTRVLIVGHSFGAKTTLDLASDPDFNGGLVNVTHVVAAGYHVGPQLTHVVNDTKVGVLQNTSDVVVQGERLLHTASGAGLVGAAAHVLGSWLSPDTEPHGDVGFVANFDGGIGRDFGHHSDRYIEHLEHDGLDPVIVGFLTDVAAAGFGAPGASVAVDVSVRRRPPWNGPPPTPNPGPGQSSSASQRPPGTTPPAESPTPAPSRTPQPVLEPAGGAPD